MRGHDDLADSGMVHAPEQFQKFDLPRWGQRRFRFIKDEDALPLAAFLEETQKALAVGMREEIRRRTAKRFACGLIEISRDREKTLGPELSSKPSSKKRQAKGIRRGVLDPRGLAPKPPEIRRRQVDRATAS